MRQTSASSIEAVVFDAVGTVMYPDPPVAAAYQTAIQTHCGTSLAIEDINRVFKAELSKRSVGEDLSTNEAVEHEFWGAVIRKLCPDSDGFDACFKELFEHFADGINWRCFPDVQPVLADLQAAGIEIAIASNFDLRLHSVCDGLSELAAIDTRIISSVVGWRKPSPQFFSAVTDILGVAPERILMVGDDPVNDIAGALASGLQAALIHRSEKNANCPPGAHIVRSLSELMGVIPPSGNEAEATP